MKINFDAIRNDAPYYVEKVTVLFACTCAILTTKSVSGAAVRAPLDIITLEDLTPAERKALQYLDEQYHRSKRSGSGDLIAQLKSTIGQGIKNKIGQIAKGSASSISKISSGSSGHHYHHYDVPETYDHKSFDFWTLKKSILNTLLQAVKAIKGGVIALKGQIIKGSGKLISAKGKFVSAKGEAITELGKNIAATAILSPHKGYHHSSSGHGVIEYAHHPHYHHSGGGVEYSAPSAPGPEYSHTSGHGHHHSSPHGDKLPLSGILVLKKIPHTGRDVSHSHSHEHHEAEESKVPDFKPISHSGPGFGEIIGKFFRASSSLKPGDPEPFGDEHYEHDHHHESVQHEHHEHTEHHGDAEHDHEHHDEHAHFPDHYPPFPNIPTGHSHSSSHYDHHVSAPGSYETHEHHKPSDDYDSGKNAHASSEEHHYHESDSYSHESDAHEKLKPPSTSYGTPFEDAPSYLDYDGFPLPTKQNTKIAAPPSKPPKSSLSHLFNHVGNKQVPLNQPSSTAPSGLGNYGTTTSNMASYSQDLYGKPVDLFATINLATGSDSQNTDTLKSYEQIAAQYNLPLAKPTAYSSPSLSSTTNYQLDPRYKFSQNLYQAPASGLQLPLSSPSSFGVSSSAANTFSLPTKTSYPKTSYQNGRGAKRPKQPSNYDVVRSLTYQLGPNGPKRL